MPKTKCSWNHARSETSTRTGNVICQRPKVEEAIWAALQKLPVGQSSCHEDCQASWWFGRDHAVAGARAVDDLGCP